MIIDEISNKISRSLQKLIKTNCTINQSTGRIHTDPAGYVRIYIIYIVIYLIYIVIYLI